MKKIIYPPKSTWSELLNRNLESHASLEKAVSTILRAIRRSGDKALHRFVSKYDKVHLDNFLVTPEEYEEAMPFISNDLKSAIRTAKYNIAQFHMQQKESIKKVETTEGVVAWQKSIPIEKVGLYIPSRNAHIFSTIMMLGIPANIAGCEEIILCSAPDENGKLDPITLYTAQLLNIRKVYKIGGVQAIGAMAYGTESIPKVDKIFGPSNQYVTAAKQLVGKNDVAIDLPAGPTEMIVLADETCNPKFVAADLLANAEQMNHSQSIAITNSEELLDQILTELEIQLESSDRKEIAQKSLEKGGKGIVFHNSKQALEFINAFAPENLMLCTKDAEKLGEQVKAAGSVYLGNYSTETAGNYASGPNSTLPTGGYARAYSGVSVDSFVKKVNFQNVSAEGLKRLGNDLKIMANAEELTGRAKAVEVRLESLKPKPKIETEEKILEEEPQEQETTE